MSGLSWQEGTKGKHSRQERANERQKVSDERTPEEQLARLDQLGHTAKKERAKLQKRIKANR